MELVEVHTSWPEHHSYLKKKTEWKCYVLHFSFSLGRGGKSGRICDTRRENTINIVVQQELEDKCAKSQLHEQTNVLSCNYDLV